MEHETIKIIANMWFQNLVVISIFVVFAAPIVWISPTLKRWRRRRKVDRKIIARAKAADVWDTRPFVLGGRALDLKAWKDFRIKRNPGETDNSLRYRCLVVADDQHQKHTKRRRAFK